MNLETKISLGILVALVITIILLMISTYSKGVREANEVIEKKCLYGERLVFSDKVFECKWLEGVTVK